MARVASTSACVAGGEPRRLISTSSWRVSNHWNASSLSLSFSFSGDDDADVVVVADVVVAVASAEVTENAVFVSSVASDFEKASDFATGLTRLGSAESLGADAAPGEDLDRA